MKKFGQDEIPPKWRGQEKESNIGITVFKTEIVSPQKVMAKIQARCQCVWTDDKKRQGIT